MEQGAGILIATEDLGKFLLFERSNKVSSPGTYSIPGGLQKSDNPLELPIETAKRETIEETGYLPEGIFSKKSINYLNDNLIYSTFILMINDNEKQKYTPKLNHEHTKYLWINKKDLTEYPLHPGLQFTLERLLRVI